MATTYTVVPMYPFVKAPFGPPSYPLPYSGDAEAQSEIVGAMVQLDNAATGYLETNNTDPTAPVGLLDQNTTAASAAGTKYPTILWLPLFVYEGSVDAAQGAVTRTAVAYKRGCVISSNGAASGGFATLDADSTGAGDIYTTLSFASDMGTMVVGGFNEKATPAASMPTYAGSTITPSAGSKGIPGDTSPRLLVIPVVGAFIV